MAKSNYKNKQARITVKFIDVDTDEELFEIKDRNFSNVGELFPTGVVNSLIDGEIKNKTIKHIPENLMILAVAQYHNE